MLATSGRDCESASRERETKGRKGLPSSKQTKHLASVSQVFLSGLQLPISLSGLAVAEDG